MGGFGDVDFGRPMWTVSGPDSVGNSEEDINAEVILRPLEIATRHVAGT